MKATDSKADKKKLGKLEKELEEAIKQVKKEEADVETKKKQIKKREGLAKERDEKRDRRPSPHSLCVCVSVQSLKSGAWVCAVDGSWQVTGTFQLGKPHSEKVLNESMQAMSHFVVPPTADAEEMLVIEPIPDNKSVHERVQKDVAAMKEKQGDTQERVLGFKAMEKLLIDKAWDNAALFSVDSEFEDWIDAILNFLTNLLNVVIVLTVVSKQWFFPPVDDDMVECLNEPEPSSADDDGGGGAYSYEGVFVHTTFKYALILLPILNGVLITLKSQLDPETKANALAWADAKMVSETYKYRARALQYSASSGSGWVSDREKRKRGGKQLAAKTYTEQCKDINTVLRSDSTFSHAALSGTTDQEQVLDMRKKKLADVSSSEAETSMLRFDCCFAICFTGVFGFCCPTKEPETTVIKVDLEEIDVRDGQPKQKSFVDDGYSRLDASEYLACRTQLHLNRMKQEVVPASRWLTSLKILTLIFTTVSVALGSINLDLFIAVSTAIVSFFTTFMCASRCPLLRLGRRL